MESPAKTFSGVVPFDIFDEIFDLIAGEENLKELSLICLRWRYLCQHELFAAVQVDPMLSHGVCQVAWPPHSHLAPHIKRVQLTNLSKATPDPKNRFQCSTECVGLLQALPALDSIDFCHPHLDWAHIPADMLKKFVEIFSRTSFRTLEVSNGNNFPVALFLHKTNLDTIVMMDTKSLAFFPFSGPIGPFDTRLTSLGLLDTRTIKSFATFLCDNIALARAFCQNITQLSLKYVECCMFPSSLSPDTITEILGVVGTSLQSLKIEASWPCAFLTSFANRTTDGIPLLQSAPARPLDLSALKHLRQLHFSFAVPSPLDQAEILTSYIAPVILSLPVPQDLVDFSLALNYYVQVFPTILDCTQPFHDMERLIEPLFMTASWVGLKKMSLCLQLSRDTGLTIPGETQQVDSPFRKLVLREIYVEGFTRV